MLRVVSVFRVIFVVAVCLGFAANAQNMNGLVVKGATLHVGNGVVIENALLVAENGKIIFVGKASDFKGSVESKSIIEANGKHVYPGLISLVTKLGLTELEAVRASIDNEETGEINPHVRAIVAYNTDSDIIPTVRSNGVLYAQIVPMGGLVSGNSSVVALDGWSWEEAAYRVDEGLHVNWPSFYPNNYQSEDAKAKHNDERQEKIEKIKALLADAKAYATATPQEKNIKLEALKGLFDGSKTLYLDAVFSKDIIESVSTAQGFGIKKIVVTGAKDCVNAIDFLKANNIPVILYRIHANSLFAENDIDYDYKLPAMLKKAGVLFALSYYGDMEAAHSRNMAFIAGTAAAYGLSKEEALESITLSSARILGIDKTTGSIETGKDASFIISEGDLLDMRTSKISMAFLKGKLLDLNDKHKELNRKYSAKYGIK